MTTKASVSPTPIDGVYGGLIDLEVPPNAAEEDPSPLVPRPPVTVGASEDGGGEAPGIVVFVPLLKIRTDFTSKYALS